MPKLDLPNAADFPLIGIPIMVKYSSLMIHELVDWCINTLGYIPELNLTPGGRRVTYDDSGVMYTFYLKTITDALLFKTRWN